MRPIDNVCPCVQKKGEVAKKEKLRGVIMLEQIKALTSEDREFTITTLEGDTVLVSPRGRAIQFGRAFWLTLLRACCPPIYPPISPSTAPGAKCGECRRVGADAERSARADGCGGPCCRWCGGGGGGAAEVGADACL